VTQAIEHETVARFKIWVAGCVKKTMGRKGRKGQIRESAPMNGHEGTQKSQNR
jgi:hypothetical protein